MLGLGSSIYSNVTSLDDTATVYTPGVVQPWTGTLGLRWWYVSNQNDNPAVGEWVGSEGASRQMQQTVTAKQPSIVNTTPGYAEFDGSNDFYRLADSVDTVEIAASRAATFMFVYKINTIDADHAIVSGGQGLNTKFSFPANDRFRLETETAQQLFVANGVTPFTTSGIKVLFVQRDSNGAVSLYQQGGGTLEAIPLDNSSSVNTTSNTVIKLNQMSGI